MQQGSLKQDSALILTNNSTMAVTGFKNSMAALREAKRDIIEKKTITKQEEQTILILDISPSMAQYVDEKLTRLDALSNVVKKMPLARKIYFSGKVIDRGTSVDIPDTQAEGGTNLGLAFNYICDSRIHNNKKLILVSDGEPDSEDYAITVAIKLKQPVFIIFIGEHGSKGELFMKNLANITGGTETTISEKTQNFNLQLNNAVRLLLA